MDKQYRTEEETREMVSRRFEELAGKLSEAEREKVKRKFDEWVTDDAIRGLSYESDSEALGDIDDFFKGALEYVREMGG